jgi:hypothetical protein
VAGNIEDEAFHNGRGFAEIVEPRSRPFLTHACRNDRDIGRAAITEVTDGNARRVREDLGISQVLDMTFGPTLIAINQDDFGWGSGEKERVSGCRSYEPSPNDGHSRNPSYWRMLQFERIVVHFESFSFNSEVRQLFGRLIA